MDVLEKINKYEGGEISLFALRDYIAGGAGSDWYDQQIETCGYALLYYYLEIEWQERKPSYHA